MKQLLNKLKLVGRYFLSIFPHPLPIGMKAFEAFAKDVIDLSGMPDNDSIRFAIAAMIIRLGPTEAFKSKFYFVLALRKGAATQIAGAVMEDLKAKEKAKMQATSTAPNA